VLPILKTASGLRWVSSLPIWSQISTDYRHRQDALGFLLSIEGGPLANFVFSSNQKQTLNNWANGNFISDYNPSPQVPGLTPDGLDFASLSQAVGGGFYPGIEAGIRMTSSHMYSSPFRITSTPFVYAGVLQTPHASFITARFTTRRIERYLGFAFTQ
jgi:hypothetical protein